MIDVKRLRQEPDAVRAALARRLDPTLDAALERILELDRRRRDVLVRVEALRAERKTASEEVARRKRNKESADDLLAKLAASGEEEKALSAQERDVDAALGEALLVIPNLPLAEVPDGDGSANPVVRTWGTAPAFAFQPKPHWELGAAL